LVLVKYFGLCIVCCESRATKLTKGNRTLGKFEGFSEYTQTQAINYTRLKFTFYISFLALAFSNNSFRLTLISRWLITFKNR